MWYLAILVALGVSTVNSQLDRLDCRLVRYSSSRCPGAVTSTTVMLSQEAICRCFDNSLIYRPTDRFLIQAVNSNSGNFFYNVSIAELCCPEFQQQGLRLIFPSGSTDYRLKGFVVRDGIIIADTAESDVISLRTSRDYRTIDNTITHSGSVIDHSID